jgi:nucleotide-binding universal stress UspA family protein
MGDRATCGMSSKMANPAGVFARIVCGVDGSDESAEAVRQATRLAIGSVHIVACMDVPAATHAGAVSGQLVEQLQVEADEALARARSVARSPTTSQQVAGLPAETLLTLLEQEDATLVAVGSKGTSRAAGVLFGSVTTRLLHDAPCSVLVARRSPLPGEFPQRIVVGVDGSRESVVAVAVAVALGRRFGADVRPIVAIGDRRPQPDLERVRGITDTVIVDPGTPVTALTEASSSVDLVVVGSRGLHGIPSIGSVSERVAHNALCSVIVVRPHTT